MPSPLATTRARQRGGTLPIERTFLALMVPGSLAVPKFG
jgi:hypothetical protein